MPKWGCLKSQILGLFGVCAARPRHWLRNFETYRFEWGLRCDEDGNGVDLDARNVPKWSSEITDSRAVWRLCGTVAELAKHTNPKRPIAEPRGI